MKFACILASLLALAGSVLYADSCGSFRDARDRSSIDFAPLPGFVDVCSRDFQLCVKLTLGYPPSVQTIGYFVPVEEWERYQKRQHKGFSRYLIAQKGRTLSTEEFAEFKRYVHSQQGNIADHTNPPASFESRGRVSLGVIDETSDSIALQLKGESLSLYVYDSAKDANDTERVKELATRWLRCIKTQNPK